MAPEIEKKQLKELKDISNDLDVIRESTRPKHAFVRGIFQGVGIVVGSVIALTIIGWILGLLGFIPGFEAFEESLKSSVDAYERRMP